MSEQKFLKAACEQCGENIEFPAEGIGMVITCPHCQKRTVLRVAGAPPPPTPAPAREVRSVSTSAAPPTIPPPVPPAAAPRETSPAMAEAAEPRKSRMGLLIVIALGILVLGAAGFFAFQNSRTKPETESAPPLPRAKVKKPAKTNTEAAASEEAPPAAKKAKTLQDLKTGSVILEKSKGGSSLVYGVGDVKNDSEYQRFGVKVELSVFDAKGKNVGKATDYIQVIEPHGTWRFHALILDDKATSAKIASVTEAE